MLVVAVLILYHLSLYQKSGRNQLRNYSRSSPVIFFMLVKKIRSSGQLKFERDTLL